MGSTGGTGFTGENLILILHDRLRRPLWTRLGDERPHRFELIGVDNVAHARVDALVDHGAELTEHPGGLVHAFQRNMRVDIAAAEEDGRTVERAGIGTRGAGRPENHSVLSQGQNLTAVADVATATGTASREMYVPAIGSTQGAAMA